MKRPPKPKVQLTGLLSAAGSIVCASTLLGFAGKFWWVFDLFSHFRVQYFLAISVILVLLLIAGKYRTCAAFGLCAAINLVCILPYYLPADDPAAGDSYTLRAISINVNTANRSYDSVKRFISENNPDFLLLMEVNSDWVNALRPIESLFPYHRYESREDNFGIALYSKLPYSKCEIIYLGDSGVPSVAGEFQIGDQRLTLIGTHPLPPINQEYSRLRNNQVDAIAKYLSSISGPKMLLGDLNMSPWSYHFYRLLDKTALKDSSRGRGLYFTWPANQVLLRIPIDVCLVSEEIGIKNRMVGPDVGSDHFPLIVDFGVSK